MRAYFADTSYYLALSNESDELHELALAVTPVEAATSMVTTTWVLTETLNALCRPPLRQKAVKFVRDCIMDPRMAIVPASQELFEAGFDFFARRPDKEWSFTDCISFIVMSERGIRDALSGDHHFEQAGFNILLK